MLGSGMGYVFFVLRLIIRCPRTSESSKISYNNQMNNYNNCRDNNTEITKDKVKANTVPKVG